MVPGLDKLEKDYAEIDTDEEKNANISINPNDINVSYLNYPSNERGKRTDISPPTYNEKLCKIVYRNIITTLQNLKTREDLVSYLEDIQYNPIVKNIDTMYHETFPIGTSEVRVSVSITLVDNTNICYHLSLYY